MKILVVGMSPLPFRFYQALQNKYEVSVRSLTKNVIIPITKEHYDLMLIWADQLSVLMLKKVLRHLISRFPTLTILIAGGAYSSSQRAEILLTGARECLPARVCVQELVAKLAILMQANGATNETINSPTTFQQGDFTFDFMRCVASFREVTIPLNKKESQVLSILLRRRHALISREFLYDNVWDSTEPPISNSLEVYMSSLRRKIEKPFGLKLFETVKGLGYRVKN